MEDPADATRDDERHTDEPVEPPDKPEGMGGRGGDQSVEEVARRVSGASGDEAKATGDDDDECRPGKPREPPDDATRTSGARAEAMSESDGEDLRTESESYNHVPGKAQCEMKYAGGSTNGRDDESEHAQAITAETTNQSESRGRTGGAGDVDDDGGGISKPREPSVTLHDATHDPAHVHVDPDGDTHAEPNGSVALKSADAGSNEEVTEERRNAQAKAAPRRIVPIEGERRSALARERPTTAVEENDGRPLLDHDDVPEGSPDPPASPDEPANTPSKPQSFELEGERRAATSCDVELTGDNANASGAQEHLEDARNVPKKPTKVSEHAIKRLEREVRENSPKEARDELDDPGADADMSGPSQADEDPGNRPKVAHNASERERVCSEHQKEEKPTWEAPVELEDPKHDATPRCDARRYWECPSNVRNECADETVTPRRDTIP